MSERDVTLQDFLAEMPTQRRAEIEVGTKDLIREIEGLRAVRELAERSQAEIARQLGVQQPSVLKMERQADLYLSSLRRFIEAAGGTLELRVELPGKGVMTLTGVGDLRA